MRRPSGRPADPAHAAPGGTRDPPCQSVIDRDNNCPQAPSPTHVRPDFLSWWAHN